MTAKPKIHQTPSPPQHSAAALPIKKYAAAWGVHPTTIWRSVRAGRLAYVVVGRRKLILPPLAQRD